MFLWNEENGIYKVKMRTKGEEYKGGVRERGSERRISVARRRKGGGGGARVVGGAPAEIYDRR